MVEMNKNQQIMTRVVTLKQAVEAIPGLKFQELYSGLRSGRYPGYRVGGPRGKWLVSLDMLEERIRELMAENLQQQKPEQQMLGKRNNFSVFLVNGNYNYILALIIFSFPYLSFNIMWIKSKRHRIISEL